MDQLLADEQIGGELLWAMNDILGSVEHMIDSNADVRVSREYDAFGNVLEETHYNASGTQVTTGQTGYVDEAFAFTGRWFDKNTDLQNNLNRWYDADTGRWLSEDPIGFLGGDTNLYRYVGNEPTGTLDPSGLGPLPFPSEPQPSPVTPPSIVVPYPVSVFPGAPVPGDTVVINPGFALPPVDTPPVNFPIDGGLPSNILKDPTSILGSPPRSNAALGIPCTPLGLKPAKPSREKEPEPQQPFLPPPPRRPSEPSGPPQGWTGAKPGQYPSRPLRRRLGPDGKPPKYVPTR